MIFFPSYECSMWGTLNRVCPKRDRLPLYDQPTSNQSSNKAKVLPKCDGNKIYTLSITRRPNIICTTRMEDQSLPKCDRKQNSTIYASRRRNKATTCDRNQFLTIRNIWMVAKTSFTPNETGLNIIWPRANIFPSPLREKDQSCPKKRQDPYNLNCTIYEIIAHHIWGRSGFRSLMISCEKYKQIYINRFFCPFLDCNQCRYHQAYIFSYLGLWNAVQIWSIFI